MPGSNLYSDRWAATQRSRRWWQTHLAAHSKVLTTTTDWNVRSQLIDDGAIMTVASNDSESLEIIKALGFFGVMATGAHHQAHHLAKPWGDIHVHD